MIRTQVVVIGGALAGSACAIRLFHSSIDVLVLDRGYFPRSKVCGAFLSPGGVRCLEELGVLPEVRAAGAVQVDKVRIEAGSMKTEARFEQPGMGISRARLDSIVAGKADVRQGHSVEKISAGRNGSGFLVRIRDSAGDVEEVLADVVVDAAGKLSRFSRRRPTRRYGVQFEEDRESGNSLDFGFFDWGYGGSVSVEGGLTNHCFLVEPSRVGEYVRRGDCTITGPIAYDRISGPYLAIGDACGMIDPFCGEGMRHALDSGRLAGGIVADGIRKNFSYEIIRRKYETAWRDQWGRKRRLAAGLRWVLDHPHVSRTAFRLGGNAWSVSRILRSLWA